MNERIQELMIQATTIEYGLVRGLDRVTFDKEKFAQLIVKECTKVCNDVGVAIFAEPVQNNFGTAQTCKLAIEKHFGVEE
jgi:hypothetical protein